MDNLREVVRWEQMKVTRGLEEMMRGDSGMGRAYAKAKEERGRGVLLGRR